MRLSCEVILDEVNMIILFEERTSMLTEHTIYSHLASIHIMLLFQCIILYRK